MSEWTFEILRESLRHGKLYRIEKISIEANRTRLGLMRLRLDKGILKIVGKLEWKLRGSGKFANNQEPVVGDCLYFANDGSVSLQKIKS